MAPIEHLNDDEWEIVAPGSAAPFAGLLAGRVVIIDAVDLSAEGRPRGPFRRIRRYPFPGP